MLARGAAKLSEFVQDLCFQGHDCLWNFFGVFLEISKRAAKDDFEAASPSLHLGRAVSRN